MVALRRLPRDLPPPLDDGRPTRSVHPYDSIKMHLWGGIVNAASTAMKNKWPGRRACIDLFASYGLNRIDETGELCWGSALLSLHADAGFDTYIFCDKDPRATKVLCERIADERYFALPVFDVDIGAEDAGARTTEIKGATTDGPKVIVITGDANDALGVHPRRDAGLGAQPLCLGADRPAEPVVLVGVVGGADLQRADGRSSC